MRTPSEETTMATTRGVNVAVTVSVGRDQTGHRYVVRLTGPAGEPLTDKLRHLIPVDCRGDMNRYAAARLSVRDAVDALRRRGIDAVEA